MNEAASDVYEIVLEETQGPKRWFRSAFALIAGLVAQAPVVSNPGGTIISVRDIYSGTELFRHIEDMGDDEGHLLHGIQEDLASMTALEFKARWASD